MHLYGQTAFQPPLNSFSTSQISFFPFQPFKPIRSAFLIFHLWNQVFNISALQVFNTQIRCAFPLFSCWAFPIFSFTAFLLFRFSPFSLFCFSAFLLFRFSPSGTQPSVSQLSQLLKSAIYLLVLCLHYLENYMEEEKKWRKINHKFQN